MDVPAFTPSMLVSNLYFCQQGKSFIHTRSSTVRGHDIMAGGQAHEPEFVTYCPCIQTQESMCNTGTLHKLQPAANELLLKCAGVDGNPLAVVAKQLGIPMHNIREDCPMFLEDGALAPKELDDQVCFELTQLVCLKTLEGFCVNTLKPGVFPYGSCGGCIRVGSALARIEETGVFVCEFCVLSGSGARVPKTQRDGAHQSGAGARGG